MGLIVLHELNLAVMYWNRSYAMMGGKIAGQGPPRELLTPELIRQVYAAEAKIMQDEEGGRYV